MNKEIVKRKLARQGSQYGPDGGIKPPRKPMSWTTLAKMAIIPVIILQAFVSVYLTQSDGFNGSYLGLGLFGALILAVVYLLLSICVDRDVTPKMQMVRELVLVSAMLLTMFILQFNFLANHKKESHFLENVINFTSIFGILTVFIMIQDLLKMSVYSRMITIGYFFVFLCLVSELKYDIPRRTIYLNTMVPLFMIGVLSYMQGKMSKKHRKIKKRKANFSEFVKESIFTYGKDGNIGLVNDWILREGPEDPAPPVMEIFRKIKDVVLFSEEKMIEKHSEKNDDSGDMSKDNMSGAISPRSSSTMRLNPSKSRDMKHIVIQLDESFTGAANPNLDGIVKTIYMQVAKKEIDEKKGFHYKANLYEKKRVYNLEVSVYACPRGEFPVVIVIRDESKEQELEELRNCERSRDTMFRGLSTEINTVIDISRTILENALISIQGTPSFEMVKNTMVSSTEQVLVPLIVAIGDIFDFCSAKVTKLNFMFALCDLRRAIEKTVKLYYHQSQGRGLQIVFEEDKDSQSSYICYTDEKRLIQLLMRLLSNAIKFSNNGVIKVMLKAYATNYSITIEDSGVGIPAQALEKITDELKTYQFDNVKTLHSRVGKTQGLPIAQMIATGLGPGSSGGLNIKSEPGTGTSVTFILDNSPPAGLEQLAKKRGEALFISSPRNNGSNSQRAAFSPARPSKFRMTYDYEGAAQDQFDLMSELSESVEVNNPNHYSLEDIQKRSSFHINARSKFAEDGSKIKSRSEPRKEAHAI